MNVLNDLGLWLWKLLPANPILVRVVNNGGKRIRHMWVRLIYLATLMAVFVFSGASFLGAAQGTSLADMAKQSTQIFLWVSMVQLFLMSFIAPVFCAAAITQEKDANTFHILLTTPLSNAQIVLGALFSRLFFVWALLLAGLPIFCITMLYGGVTTREIFESFGLAACTALLTGSIAILISFMKIGTRRTIFTFFAGIAVYLLGLYFIGMSSVGQLAVAPSTTVVTTAQTTRMSWLAPVHPFLALWVVIGKTPAPGWPDVAGFGWPRNVLLAYPQYSYMVLTTLVSATMVLVCLIFVRRGSRDGEGTWATRLMQRFLPRQIGERRRKPRRVWRNPIAWREAATRASASGRSALRPLLIAAALAAGVVLFIAHHAGWWGLGPKLVPTTRLWLTALVWIELAVVLLVVTNTAATTLTREKEAFTMELLLTTPLTSRYIVAGMLQGLIRLVIPLIGVPFLTITLFTVGDLVRFQAEPVTTPEAIVTVPLLMVAFAALAAMIGLHFSLMSKKTVQAVMVSTSIVLGAAGLLWACGLAVSNGGQQIAAVILPFTPFPALQAALDPWRIMQGGQTAASWGGVQQLTPEIVLGFRIVCVVFSVISAAAYLGITLAVYKNMVGNFDMTVRRQSA